MKCFLVFILSILSLAHGYRARMRPPFASFSDVKPMATDPHSDLTPISKHTTTTSEPSTNVPSSNTSNVSKWWMKGYQVSKTASTFMATIRENPSDLYLCSATFIRKDALLTTARCLLGRDPEKLSVHSNSSYLGTEGLGNVAVKNVYIHPEFDMNPVQMDFAIITLKTPVESITPVSLPSKRIGRPGSVGTMYTWRFTQDSQRFLIHEHQSKIISKIKCFLFEHEIVPDDVVCAFAHGIPFQQGGFDHGMPFIINKKGSNYLFGINYITGKVITEKVDKIWKIDGIVPWITDMLDEDNARRKTPTNEKPKDVSYNDDDVNVDDEEEEEKEEEEEEEENYM